jgi:hypothetical protein
VLLSFVAATLCSLCALVAPILTGRAVFRIAGVDVDHDLYHAVVGM